MNLYLLYFHVQASTELPPPQHFYFRNPQHIAEANKTEIPSTIHIFPSQALFANRLTIRTADGEWRGPSSGLYSTMHSDCEQVINSYSTLPHTIIIIWLT